MVIGVCRSKRVEKLDRFKDRIIIFPGDSKPFLPFLRE